MLILWLLISYLIGTFPSGMLVGKFYQTDISKHGSGNVGATNVARSLGPKAGILTLILDLTKGLIGTISTELFFNGLGLLGGVATVLGHCFSLPGLKGGKGVATSLGVLLAYNPLLAFMTCLIFGITFKVSKIVSLSSLAAAIMLPVLGFFVLADFWLIVALSVLVIYKHRANILRLIKGEEERFKSKK